MKDIVDFLLLSFILAINVFIMLSFLGIIWSAAKGAPFVPSSRKRAEKMMEFARIRKGEKVYDLGCGDGRLVFMAAKKGAVAEGFEVSPVVYFWAKVKKFFGKHGGKITRADFWDMKFEDADVIFLYLFPGLVARFEKEVWSRLKKGTRVISNGFPFPNITPTEKWKPEGTKIHKIFVYRK